MADSNFKLPEGVFKINGGLYELGDDKGSSLNAINPKEAEARFGSVMPISQVLSQAPETSVIDLQSKYKGIQLPTNMDTTQASTTPGFNKYLGDTSQTTDQVTANRGTPQINTSQPSPVTVQSQPFTNPNTTLTGGNANSSTPSTFEKGFNDSKAAGVTTPTSPSKAADIIGQYTQSQPTNKQADVVINSNQAYQQYLKDFTFAQSSQAQGPFLTQMYQNFAQQLGIPAIDTKLINLQNVIDGNEQMIRDEITKAGGFATEGQVIAMTNARNKQNLANYKMLVETRNNAQNNLTAMLGLAEKDRAYASAQIDRQLNFDQQQIQHADKMLSNAQETLSMNAKAQGWDNVLKSALATGDSQAIDRINSVMGPGFDIRTFADQDAQNRVQALAKEQATQNKPIEVSPGATLFNPKTGKAIYTAPTARQISGSNSSGNIVNNGLNTGDIPREVAPYVNTSSSGVKYVDASTLQGTAKDKKSIIDQAQKAGLKIITNKNTAADLSNIQDANNKLDTISTIMKGIDQPGWVQRNLYGAGLTKLATLAQSNPQQAAAGSLQVIGLDILKAMSGTQGFRGNSSVVKQVNEHLPSIYDTDDVVQQKVAYFKQLLADRETGLLGTNSSSNKQSNTPANKMFDNLFSKYGGQ